MCAHGKDGKVDGPQRSPNVPEHKDTKRARVSADSS